MLLPPIEIQEINQVTNNTRKAFHRIIRRVRMLYNCVSAHNCVSAQRSVCCVLTYGEPYLDTAGRILIRRFLRFSSRYGAHKFRIFGVFGPQNTEGQEGGLYVKNHIKWVVCRAVCYKQGPYVVEDMLVAVSRGREEMVGAVRKLQGS